MQNVEKNAKKPVRPRVRPKGDALAFLTAIYKDQSKPDNLRLDAAKAAIRYERPALAPVEQQVETDFIPLHERIKRYTAREASEASSGKVVALKTPEEDEP